MTTPSSTAVLTPADHDFFLSQGFLIVKNVVPAETIAEAVAFLEGGATEGDVGGANYKPRMGEAVRACVTDTVFAVLEELLGPEYPIPRNRDAVDMPRVYTPDVPWTSQGLHVDSDYSTRMPNDDVLSFFLFLTPVRSHGGAFQYAPGSPQRYFAAMGDNPEQLKSKTARPDLSGPVQEYLAEPGDLLIMTHLGGHAGSNNVTDPTTRHALLHRFHPSRRLVPGAKPFAHMSSVEKVYSARYLREVQGFAIPEAPLTPDERTTAALRDGVVVAPDIRAYVTFIEQGVPGLLFVTESSPGVLQRAVAADFVTFAVRSTCELPGFTADSLQDYKRDEEITLLAGTGTDVRLLIGPDGAGLRQAAALPDVALAFAHYTTDFGSKIAHERVLFVRPADKPNHIYCGWGKTWEDVFAGEFTTLASQSPEGSTIVDAFANPTCGGPPFALIADVREAGAKETRPYFSVSNDVARYDAPLEPLAYCTEDESTAPHRIRIYARARFYWLVTYLQTVGAETRLYWGAIDWEKAPPKLEPIRTAQELQDALAVVGWI